MNTAPLLIESHPPMVKITLNRPTVLNSLTQEMIQLIKNELEKATTSKNIQFILLQGSGDRAFCAGADVKFFASLIKEGHWEELDLFFKNEYELDLLIHQYPKPIIVLADGITMGGGLGLAAGADIVIATERTRIAMPETRIGFFPDIGATGWLFSKVPPGYPEYLALTGYDMKGKECVRVGLATDYVLSKVKSEIITRLENYDGSILPTQSELVSKLHGLLEPFVDTQIPKQNERDLWVKTHFMGKKTIQDLMKSLATCEASDPFCKEVYRSISERSPTALVLTLKLLRVNEGKPLVEVFENERKATQFITRHPDFLEGIRARLIDKDNHPNWNPGTIEGVNLSKLEL